MALVKQKIVRFLGTYLLTHLLLKFIHLLTPDCSNVFESSYASIMGQILWQESFNWYLLTYSLTHLLTHSLTYSQ